MAKKRSDRLKLVQELAERKKKQADQYLAESRQQVQQGEVTLQQLEQYIAEYQRRLISVGQTGVNIAELTKIQQFIEKLTATMRQHKESMKVNEEQLERVKAHWQQSYGHLKAMERLTETAEQKEQAEAEKALQKTLDERSQLKRSNFI